MKCPHCGEEMVKEAIQAEDLSGWYVGWMCGCPMTEEHVQIVVHASKDWTANILVEAGVTEAFNELEEEKENEYD